MKGRSGYSITTNKLLDNYKIASLITLLPWTYTLNLFVYMSVESFVQGLIVLPFTLALTPVFLGATSIGFVANTAWGVVALPIAVIKNYRSPEHLEHEIQTPLERNTPSFTKAQMMLAGNSVHDLVFADIEDDVDTEQMDHRNGHEHDQRFTFSALSTEPGLELDPRAPGYRT